MRNIPTDLLRALVTIVDLKGFTRAGEQLGRAQPTISLQMKRLQELVGVPLLERDAGPPRLTEAGEICVAYARRILALHDEMLHRLETTGAGDRLRLGLPNDYADHFLPGLLRLVETAGLQIKLEVVCDISETLLREMADNSLDLVIATTPGVLADGATRIWPEKLGWIGSPDRPPDDTKLRLVAAPEGCAYRRTMLSVLQRDGKSAEIAYTTASLTGIEAAIRAGFGITAMAARMVPAGLTTLEGMPTLPDLTAGLYVNPRTRGPQVHRLATLLGDLLAPS